MSGRERRGNTVQVECWRQVDPTAGAKENVSILLRDYPGVADTGEARPWQPGVAL